MTVLSKTLYRVDVVETPHGRAYWASRPNLTGDTVKGIRSAEFVIVPWENRGTAVDSFPVGTATFFKELRDLTGPGRVTIAIDQENYVELALHADERRWPHILVEVIGLGLLVNLLSAQIDRMMQEPSPPASLELKLTIENTNGKCISIDYKGPPSEAVDAIIKQSERCLPPEPYKDSGAAHKHK